MRVLGILAVAALAIGSVVAQAGASILVQVYDCAGSSEVEGINVQYKDPSGNVLDEGVSERSEELVLIDDLLFTGGDRVVSVQGGSTSNWYSFQLEIEVDGDVYTITNVSSVAGSPQICDYSWSGNYFQVDMSDY